MAKSTLELIKNDNFQIVLADDTQSIPFDLLQLADPSLEQINQYLNSSKCYIAKLDSEVIGVLVLTEISQTVIEIKNIAINELYQGKGLGKELLRFAEKSARLFGYKKLIIGTGNSSIGQLALYQKAGFEMTRIKKDFFIKNYNAPIIENGIQCKHMVVLEKRLNKE